MDYGEQALASLSSPQVLGVEPTARASPLGSSSEKWDKDGSRAGRVKTKI